jgi:hypothetical protein
VSSEEIPSLTAPTADAWTVWAARFDEAEQAIITLFYTRWMWETITDVRGSADDKRQNAIDYYFLRTYVATVCAAIRREADKKTSTSSLASCIAALGRRPAPIDRDRFVTLYLAEYDSTETQASRAFDAYALDGSKQLDAAGLFSDIAYLEQQTSAVEKYTDEVIAHRSAGNGKTRLESTLTFDQINDAIDSVGKIAMKYYELRHPGQMLAQLTPVGDLSFLSVFQNAWMKPGFTLTEHPHSTP